MWLRPTAAMRRRRLLHRLKWTSIAIALGAAASLLAAQLDARFVVFSFALAMVVAAVTARASWKTTIISTCFAFLALRMAVDYALDYPYGSQSIGASMLIVAVVAAVQLTRASTNSHPQNASRSRAQSLGYEAFVSTICRSVPHAGRHQMPTTLVLMRLKDLESLLNPACYQQHDLLIAQFSAALRSNLRRLDAACYLGNLLFAVALRNVDVTTTQQILERLKVATAPLSRRLCAGMNAGVVDWDAVCLEHRDGKTEPEQLLAEAARQLSGAAIERLSELERRRHTTRRQLERLGYA